MNMRTVSLLFNEKAARLLSAFGRVALAVDMPQWPSGKEVFKSAIVKPIGEEGWQATPFWC